jgi:hypothetical protein
VYCWKIICIACGEEWELLDHSDEFSTGISLTVAKLKGRNDANDYKQTPWL